MKIKTGLNGFDDCPENRTPSFECPECIIGDVEFDSETNLWSCNNCDFSRSNK